MLEEVEFPAEKGHEIKMVVFVIIHYLVDVFQEKVLVLFLGIIWIEIVNEIDKFLFKLVIGLNIFVAI